MFRQEMYAHIDPKRWARYYKKGINGSVKGTQGGLYEFLRVKGTRGLCSSLKGLEGLAMHFIPIPPNAGLCIRLL